MQIIEANVIFYNQLKTCRPKMTSNPHAQFNTVKLYLTKKKKKQTETIDHWQLTLFEIYAIPPIKKK